MGQFRVWTPLTYYPRKSIRPLPRCSAYIFWRFGEDLEKFFGRRAFVRLFLLLVLLTPVVLTVFGLLGHGNWASSWASAGRFWRVHRLRHTLPSRATDLAGPIVAVPAGVLAMFYVGIMAVIHLASPNWPGLIMLACQVLAAYGFVRYQQGRWSLETL